MVRNYKRKTEDRWTKEDLLEALLCIKDAKLKINDAARQYGISRATLYRQYQKFILAGGKCDVNQFRTCGGNPILTKVEEDVLEKTIRDLREQGFTVTSSDIKRICFEYCDSNGIPNQFNQEKRMASDDWYYGFLKRHPDVRIPKPGQTNSTSRASSIASSAASITSPDKSPKTKKLKLTPPPKKIMKHDRTPPRSPVHVLTASPSKVTSGKKEKQTMEAVAAATSAAAMKGRKQKQGAVAAAAIALKKPLKRLIPTKPSVSRGKKGKAILPHIPTDEEDEMIKEEIDSEDMEEDDEEEGGINLGDDDLEEVMQTEEVDEDDDDEDEEEEEEEDEEEGEEEDVGRSAQVENEDEEQEAEDDVEMDEDEEEQDEAEKSDSDEEEVEEEEAEGDDDEDEEGEVVEEQEDAEEDAEAENDADEGEEEEEGEEDEEGDDDEDDDDEEEEDDEEDDGAVVKTEKDDSDSDGECTSDELLEKLLDNM